MLPLPKGMSEFVVYVDESGDHGPTSPDYPVFVLVFCVFRKVEYANAVVPSVSTLKFKYFGHDGVVFHERDIRKALGPFAILQNPSGGWHSSRTSGA